MYTYKYMWICRHFAIQLTSGKQSTCAMSQEPFYGIAASRWLGGIGLGKGLRDHIPYMEHLGLVSSNMAGWKIPKPNGGF